MKALVAVISCHKRLPWNVAIRSTWLPEIKSNVDVVFFYGRGEHQPLLEDEVILDCGDSYDCLPEKVRAVIRWAIDHDYDFLLKCDDDVVLRPDYFLKSGYGNRDFVGPSNGYAIVQGNLRDKVSVPWGFCYWLSRRAMEAVKNAPLPQDNNDEMWVSLTLAPLGMRLCVDNRYYIHRGFPPPKEKGRRPLRRAEIPDKKAEDGVAFCIHVLSDGFNRAPMEISVEEFYKVFARYVGKATKPIVSA